MLWVGFGSLGRIWCILYGKGPRAFIRLQEKIIRTTTDHSIFVWDYIEDRPHPLLLASSPRHFANGHKVVRLKNEAQHDNYESGNSGLRIKLPFTEAPDISAWYLACLNRDDFKGPIALYVQPLRSTERSFTISGSGWRYRVAASTEEHSKPREVRDVTIMRTDDGLRMRDHSQYSILVRLPHFCSVESAHPPRSFNHASGLMQVVTMFSGLTVKIHVFGHYICHLLFIRFQDGDKGEHRIGLFNLVMAGTRMYDLSGEQNLAKLCQAAGNVAQHIGILATWSFNRELSLTDPSWGPRVDFRINVTAFLGEYINVLRAAQPLWQEKTKEALRPEVARYWDTYTDAVLYGANETLAQIHRELPLKKDIVKWAGSAEVMMWYGLDVLNDPYSFVEQLDRSAFAHLPSKMPVELLQACNVFELDAAPSIVFEPDCSFAGEH